MGVNIDVRIYNKPALLERLAAWGATDADLTGRILDACGTTFGDVYVLLNNEYYEDENPYYHICDLIEAAFHAEDSFDVFLDTHNEISRDGIAAIDVEDIAARLGISLPDESEEDE